MSESQSRCPIITIDGPGGSGKGTVSRLLALELGWHCLDSGALYRLVGLKMVEKAIPPSAEARITALTRSLKIEFQIDLNGDSLILLDGRDVTTLIREEEVGKMASYAAALGGVREALLDLQRAFVKAPGLIADGRDMGTVIFPDADLKVFLTASAEERANRRHKQLNTNKNSGNLSALLQEIKERDARDTERALSPLIAASDAITIDSTHQSIESVVSEILAHYRTVEERKQTPSIP